jgi:glyoxylase-like metal-dependent hydrolase (beta-lactamase superfamily II)
VSPVRSRLRWTQDRLSRSPSIRSLAGRFHCQLLRFFTTAVEAFGHTPGMLAFNISSGSESVFYSADTLHHFALYIVHPEWHVGFDNDQELGARTRLRVLNQVIAERSLVLVPHFPFPGLGHITQQGQVRSWEPIVWHW